MLSGLYPAAIRGARTHSRAASHPRQRPVHVGLRGHRVLSPASLGCEDSGCSPRHRRLRRQTPNSSSARAVVERLLIDHVSAIARRRRAGRRHGALCALYAGLARRRAPRTSPAIPTAALLSIEPRAERARRSARILTVFGGVRPAHWQPISTAPGNATWSSRC